jgi:hypothetical protein
MSKEKGTPIPLALAKKLSGLPTTAEFERQRLTVQNNGVVCCVRDTPTVDIVIVTNGPTSRYFLRGPEGAVQQLIAAAGGGEKVNDRQTKDMPAATA